MDGHQTVVRFTTLGADPLIGLLKVLDWTSTFPVVCHRVLWLARGAEDKRGRAQERDATTKIEVGKQLD